MHNTVFTVQSSTSFVKADSAPHVKLCSCSASLRSFKPKSLAVVMIASAQSPFLRNSSAMTFNATVGKLRTIERCPPDSAAIPSGAPANGSTNLAISTMNLSSFVSDFEPSAARMRSAIRRKIFDSNEETSLWTRRTHPWNVAPPMVHAQCGGT